MFQTAAKVLYLNCDTFSALFETDEDQTKNIHPRPTSVELAVVDGLPGAFQAELDRRSEQGSSLAFVASCDKVAQIERQSHSMTLGHP